MPQTEEAPTTERDRVEWWRVHLLVEAGMSFTDARTLSALDNWRDALDLLEAGCPSHLAFEIVR